MTALVKAELLKLRTTRMTIGLVAATLALVVLTVIASVPQVGGQSGSMSLDDVTLLAHVVGESLGVPEVLVLLLGVLSVTQEFWYGTHRLVNFPGGATPQGRPRREVARADARERADHGRDAACVTRRQHPAHQLT